MLSLSSFEVLLASASLHVRSVRQSFSYQKLYSLDIAQPRSEDTDDGKHDLLRIGAKLISASLGLFLVTYQFSSVHSPYLLSALSC